MTARQVRRVARFVEKPPRSLAEDYLRSGRHLWNSGMFCFTPRAILAALAAHAPQVLDAVTPVWAAIDAKGNGRMLEIDAALFAAVPDISIDYAVMEKAAEGRPGVVAVRGAFDWSDVGSWQAIAELVAGRRSTATAARASASRSTRATRSSMPRTASSPPSGSTTW